IWDPRNLATSFEKHGDGYGRMGADARMHPLPGGRDKDARTESSPPAPAPWPHVSADDGAAWGGRACAVPSDSCRGGRDRLMHLDPPQLAYEHTMGVRGEDHTHRRIAWVEQAPSSMRPKFCCHIGIGHTDADITCKAPRPRSNSVASRCCSRNASLPVPTR